MLTPDPTIAKMLPITHTRNVSYGQHWPKIWRTHGMSGSSVFETAARTSSYGESSCALNSSLSISEVSSRSRSEPGKFGSLKD